MFDPVGRAQTAVVLDRIGIETLAARVDVTIRTGCQQCPLAIRFKVQKFIHDRELLLEARYIRMLHAQPSVVKPCTLVIRFREKAISNKGEFTIENFLVNADLCEQRRPIVPTGSRVTCRATHSHNESEYHAE